MHKGIVLAHMDDLGVVVNYFPWSRSLIFAARLSGRHIQVLSVPLRSGKTGHIWSVSQSAGSDGVSSVSGEVYKRDSWH